MSEVVAADLRTDGAAERPLAAFGPVLAQAREAQGISVADMASRLRLHPRQISALEEERLDVLPEAAFVRGFVRNYAKELRLDPAPLLEALAARLPVTESVPTAIGGTSAELRREGVARASRLSVVFGAIGLVIVLGIVGWVASLRVEPTATAPATTAAPAPGAPAAPAGVAPATAEGVAAPSPTDSSSASPPAAAAPAEATAKPSPAAAAGTATAVLRLSTGERPSWVEISQADGRVLLTGLQEAGTERRLGPVQPPLRVVIGNASSVTLEYRGRPVDLAPHIRANDLARLSLD